jgi:hypothetical protein
MSQDFQCSALAALNHGTPPVKFQVDEAIFVAASQGTIKGALADALRKCTVYVVTTRMLFHVLKKHILLAFLLDMIEDVVSPVLHITCFWLTIIH